MRFLSGLFLLLFPIGLLAQKETSHWYLANTANLVEPTGVTTGLPAPNNFSGAMPTSVSDAEGNLLFACDGIKVVDRDLQPMPSSASVSLEGFAGRVLAQKIPNSTRYYIFYTTSENTSLVNAPWILKYAIIDMALNGGKGDMVSYNNIVSTGLSPGYTLIQENNTGNAWLLTHQIGTNQFHAYQITTAGISTTAVTSNTGALASPTEYIFRELKTSHDGKKIAGFSYINLTDIFAYTRHHIEVFDFDFPSGTLNSKVYSTGFYTYFSIFHSVEFSPDNRLLYASFATRVSGLQPCGFGSTWVYQYNLCYTDPAEFDRFKSLLVRQSAFCFPSLSYGKIQLGADKRIHMPFTGLDISTIEYPNRIGTSASYSKAEYQVTAHNNAYMVTPGFQHRDLEKAVVNNIRYTGGCYPEPIQFEVTNDTITRIEWNFGDPASGASNTSSLLNPSHLFSAPGMYQVSAQLFNSNNHLIETVYELVEIKDPQKRLLDGYPTDTAFCQGEQLDISLNVVNGIFHWYQKTEDGTRYTHEVGDQITLNSTGRWYVEMKQNDCNGCTMVDSIDITVLPIPYVGLGFDRNLCEGDSLKLQLFDPGADYLWSNGSTNSSITVYTGDLYWVEAEYNNNGCPVRDSVVITSVPNVNFTLPSDTTLCNNEVLVLQPGVTQANYVWQNGSTSQQFTVQSPGQYWVRIRNYFGCTASDSIQVNYVSPSEISLGADSVLCKGESLSLQVNTPADYLWSTGSTANEIAINQSGEYWVSVDNGACIVADTILIQFDEPIIFGFEADTILCPGEQLLLSPGITASEYTWQDGSTTNSHLVNNAGIYWVDITRGGCTASDTIVVGYFTGLPVSLGPDQRVCEGETVSFHAGNAFEDYLWNTGSTLPSIQVSIPNQYSVIATDVNGCQSKDTVTLLPHYPLPVVDLNESPELCYNSTRLLDAGNGFVNYLWNDGSTSSTKTVSQPGTYSVIVTDNNGCEGQDAVTITTVLPLPSAFLPPDIEICQYESTLLKPSLSFESYRWSNNSTASSILVSQPGNYVLEVTDTKGCVGWDTTTVTFKNCMEGVFIPSAFTPNRDGLNDVFMPMVFGPVDQYRFTVFNRWGEIVFESRETGKGWDGTYKGYAQDAGIFIWSCTYQLPGRELEHKRGHVTLVR